MILKNENNDTCISDDSINGWEEISQNELDAIRESSRVAPSSDRIAPVSPRQIRMALTRTGLRAQVESAVASGDQDLRDWYEYSTIFERTNAQVMAMGKVLNQTETQLDALWQLAAIL